MGSLSCENITFLFDLFIVFVLILFLELGIWRSYQSLNHPTVVKTSVQAQTSASNHTGFKD